MSQANFGRCHLCQKDAPLVRSHIIPRSFFEIDSDAPPRLISNTPGEFPRKAPAGVYDRIVCEPCERSFSDYDTHAATVLLNRTPTCKPVQYGRRIVGYEASDVSYPLLKLFAIATLWRASVSSHPFYQRIQLGPFQDQARQMLAAKDPGAPDAFAVWWSIFDAEGSPGIMDPFRERWFGVNAYRFYLGRVLAYIKVDRQRVPGAFASFMLRPDRPLMLICRSLRESKDMKVMQAVVRANPRLFPAL